jgi:uncharacterized membrane protein YheB (UPF0754 family)
MNWIQYTFPVLISTFLGWVLAGMAIKMLFHPQRPIKITGIKIQGLFPQKKILFTAKLAQWISGQFIFFQDLEQKATDPENFQKLKPDIENHIDSFLKNKLKDVFPMLSVFIGDKTINQLKQAFLTELENLFPLLIKSYLKNLENDLNIEKIITEKLNTITLNEMEILFNTYIKNKLQFTGAFFGFLIGVIQVIITIYLIK